MLHHWQKIAAEAVVNETDKFIRGKTMDGAVFPENYKEVQIRLADGEEIKGFVNLGESFKRVTELMDSPSRFITVSNTNIGKTIILNKRSIVWVMPT